MIASCSFVSCNFTCSPVIPFNRTHFSFLKPSNSLFFHSHRSPPLLINPRKGLLLLRKSSLNSQQDPLLVKNPSEENEPIDGGSGGEDDDGPGNRDWTTSFLLFVFWAGLIYYVFSLAPNQQPATDAYLVQKLLNLKGEDGFKVNQVLVSLWYLMGLWPLVYSMLLFPAARSTKSKIPIWPFIVLSFAGGAYSLIPYFVLWRPPAPPTEESELRRWPLNFLESKLTAAVTFGAGLAVLAYALASSADAWTEFTQYFRGSKFIHVMSIDFVLFSTFAPFWVYNDMTTRKWDNNNGASWILPLAVIPFLGPALYLLLRPGLSEPAVRKS